MSGTGSYTPNERDTTPSRKDEVRLLVQAIKGDAAAFGELYEHYLTLIYRYIRSRVEDAHIAEDLTEMVFLKVWETLPRFQLGRVLFRTWLYRVAHNLVIDHYRTRKELNPIHEHPNLEDSSLPPEEAVLLKERQDRIVEAIQRLKPEHQHILLLRFVNGLSHEEAAEVIGRSEGAVRGLQHRALRALERELESMEGDT
jgi:RNA polymerase sigma-70 factor (ECF subfamily)